MDQILCLLRGPPPRVRRTEQNGPYRPSLQGRGEPAKDWMVLSDRPPRKLSVLREFQESDRLNILELPQDHRFQELAHKIELAMKDGARVSIRVASTEFLGAAADFYKIRRAYVHALAAQYPEHFKIMWYQGCGPKVR